MANKKDKSKISSAGLNEKIKNNPVKDLKQKAIRFLQTGEMEKLISSCNFGIRASENDAIVLEFVKLRAIGYAQSGRLLEAKQDFLRVLELNPDDGIALSNYICACLDSGDTKSALHALKIYYSDLDEVTKGCLNENILEALRIGNLRVEDLTEEILDALSARIKRVG